MSDTNGDGPPSVLKASEVWTNRNIRLVLLGQSNINGKRFTETYHMTIDAIEDPASVACVLRKALRQAAKQTTIPGDLLEGVELRFLKKGER